MSDPDQESAPKELIHQASLFEFASPENARATPEQNGVRVLNEVEKGWLAGVIDGEGSILISKIKAEDQRRGFKYRPMLGIANTNRAFLEKVRQVIGKGSIGSHKEKRYDWKDNWQYHGSASVLRGILPQVLPRLVVKQERAVRMLEYLAFIDAHYRQRASRHFPPGFFEKLDSLYLAFKHLNAKGEQSLNNHNDRQPTHPWDSALYNTGHRAGSCRMMSEAERAWLAGVIDGEGTIYLSKTSDPRTRRGFFYIPRLSVSNCNRFLLIRVGETIGEGTVQLAKRATERWKTKWAYGASAGVMRAILPQILPHLVVKQRQVEVVLEYFAFVAQNSISGSNEPTSEYYHKLDSYYLKIRELNEKGDARRRLKKRWLNDSQLVRR